MRWWLGTRALRRGVVLAAAGSLLLSSTARGDVVTLVDGKTLEGKVIEQTDAEVVVETTFDGVKRVPKAEVKAVDTSVAPLRVQLKTRRDDAGNDPARLWEVHDFAKRAGFKDELKEILGQILRQKPEDARARKALGHVKVDGKWMTPEAAAALEQQKKEDALRAQGLVPFGDKWVTPADKAALEKGLVKDGEEWVTEDELHRRHGEQKVDGRWVKIGVKEGAAYAADAGNASHVTLVHHWGPHFDVLAEVDGAVATQALDGLEKAFGVLRRDFQPQGEDLPETLERRVRVTLFKKAPAYARFAEWYGKRNKIEELQPKWSSAVQRQPAFWWVDPDPMVSVYQFPNVDKTVISNAVHNAGLVLLTLYKMNFRFPSPWLREGFAYHLEMESLGYSLSFSLGRGGGTNQGGGDTAPPWAESAKWKTALKAAVAGGTDPPLKRLAALTPEQMGYPELVKSWSVVDYLVRWDRAKFKAFVDATKEARDAPEEDALTKATGLTYRQLDDQWRAWVTAGFGKP